METIASTVGQDEDAMRRVAGGDCAALAVLFDRHKARLFAFLYHLVGDRATAEDLLGETFLRLYQTRARYRTGNGFTPWLFAIARNLALGELRRRGVAARAQQRLMQEVPDDSCADALDQGALAERVRGALAGLPEEQRSALVRKEYQQMEYREIAQVLGCSEQAARARTYRARLALREALHDWWGDERAE